MSHTSLRFFSIFRTVERDSMRYKLTESAKYKYQVAGLVATTAMLFGGFILQWLGVI